LAGRSETATAASPAFALPEEPPPTRDQNVAVGERGARKQSAAVRRTASSSVQRLSPALTLEVSHSDSPLPSYFRRRNEALPGTYDRSGQLSREQEPARSAKDGGPGPARLSMQVESEPPGAGPVSLAQAASASAPPQSAGMERVAVTLDATRELSASDESVIRDLKKLERRLMNRELEQSRVGGGVSGMGRHEVETGPDGQRYVTGAPTTPSLVQGGTPEQALTHARAVRRAAMAPSSPSSRDLSVANEARRLEIRAEERLLQARAEEQQASQVEADHAVESLESLVAREDAAAARRAELREEDAQHAARQAAARRDLSVAEIADPTVDNSAVVTLKRQFAVDAYMAQL